MPYPNEHSCRLKNPDKYDKFARKNCAEKHDGKCIDFIFGIKEGKSELQAMRYDKEIWTEGAARNHCKDHDGTFEPAKEGKAMENNELEERGAIASHKTATSDKAWDGPGNEARLKKDGDAAYYKKAYAWQDPDGDPETKADYKFIHHEVSGDGAIGAANIKGCQTGIAVLNGARGGTTIPSGDKKGVWNHLAGHIKDADLEPAPLRMSPEGKEERSYQVEMRIDDDDKPKIKGHAAVFDKLSVPIMGFREKVSLGAFAKSIQKSDIRALWNHNPDYVLGRKKSGTLTLEEDDKGLAIEILPPDTQWARDLMETIRRGDVDQMSFAFRVVKDSWEEAGKENIRTLEEVELFDVSPVTYPAYPQTDVKVRSIFEEAGLDVNRLAMVMERHTATNNEDIAVVKQATDILNSYLPEDLDGQGTLNEGYVGRLKAKRERWEFGKEINKEVTSGKVS